MHIHRQPYRYVHATVCVRVCVCVALSSMNAILDGSVQKALGEHAKQHDQEMSLSLTRHSDTSFGVAAAGPWNKRVDDGRRMPGVEKFDFP